MPEVQITILEQKARQEKEMNEIEEGVCAALSRGLTQAQASRKLRLPKSTVSAITRSLLSHNLIRKVSGKNYNLRYERVDPSSNTSEVVGYLKLCKNCKQEFRTIYKDQRYCDPLCWGETRQGPKHQNWTGGDQFYPYCWKFNDSLKERVRAYFQYRCVLCRKDERDNFDRKGHHHKLLVHHVNYNKQACCDGADNPQDKQFVSLCLSCHNKMCRPTYKKKEWQKYFSRIIEVVYDGKCYFTKEEMRPQDQYYKF